MLVGEKPSMAFELMLNLNLLDGIIPELKVLHGTKQSARWHSEGATVREKNLFRLNLNVSFLLR